MRVTRTLSALCAGVLLACASAAAAEPLPATANAASVNGGLQAMRDYNLIVLKDLKSTSEVEGRTFVGGDLSGGSSNYLTKPGAQAGGTALTVGGDVTGGPKNINNGGDVRVGGDLTSGANMNGGGDVMAGGDVKKVNANGASVYAGGDVQNTNAQHIHHGGEVKNSNGAKHGGDTSTAGLSDAIAAAVELYAAQLTDTSAYLASLAPSHTLDYSPNGQQALIDAGAGTGVAVFSISDLNAALKTRNQLIVTPPVGYDAIVINVAGTRVSLPSSINFNNGSGLGANVIWNFFEATSINLGSKSWYGSVLAPQAHLQMNNFIEGSVVARSLNQNGAIRMGSLTAPGLYVDQMRAAIPEPATWAMMILGFGAIGAVLRRRVAAAAA
jgi:choice-of-anchor A domain-containing protein